MVGFAVVGVVGVVVLALAVLLGDVLPHAALLDHLDASDGYLSTAALGGFAGAFGLAGAVATASGAATAPAVGVGVLAGLAVGALAGWLTRSLKRSPEGRAPSTADAVGAEGTVVSAVPAQGFGEVTVSVHGVRRKLGARSDRPLPAGARVRVTVALSPTSVLVEPLGPQDRPA